MLLSRPRVMIPVLVLLLVALSVGLAWVRHDRASAADVNARRCERFHQESVRRAAIVTGSGPRVMVIGDSWSSGYELRHPGRSWPVQLRGRVYVDGFPGSGFSAHASGCRQVSYADRAPRDLRKDPTLVVVEGGLNDYNQSSADITAGFQRLIGELRDHRVVVVGPAKAPSRAAAVPRVDRLLAGLCAKAEVPYLSTTDLRLTYLPGGLHPDQRSANAFGRAVAEFVAKA